MIQPTITIENELAQIEVEAGDFDEEGGELEMSTSDGDNDVEIHSECWKSLTCIGITYNNVGFDLDITHPNYAQARAEYKGPCNPITQKPMWRGSAYFDGAPKPVLRGFVQLVFSAVVIVALMIAALCLASRSTTQSVIFTLLVNICIWFSVASSAVFHRYEWKTLENFKTADSTVYTSALFANAAMHIAPAIAMLYHEPTLWAGITLIIIAASGVVVRRGCCTNRHTLFRQAFLTDLVFIPAFFSVFTVGQIVLVCVISILKVVALTPCMIDLLPYRRFMNNDIGDSFDVAEALLTISMSLYCFFPLMLL